MNKVILIGGSPLAGKTTIAKKLSVQLKIPWISTDTVREQMRKIVRKKDYPFLFTFSNATPKMAISYLTKHTPKEIVKHQNEESINVWEGVKAFIETDEEWESLIIEGIAILPKEVSKLDQKKVKAFFLIDENINNIRNKIYKRGLWDDAEKYSHQVKEKEIEWVWAVNKYINYEAIKYHLPLVNTNHKDY
ncbi:MAG: hypothetical protein AABX72_00235, partial [Nanoarchaeota archaeon]